MEQTYQRRILVERRADRLTVDLEDNFHRFGVGDGRPRLTWELSNNRFVAPPGWQGLDVAAVTARDFTGRDDRLLADLKGAR